MNDGNAGSQSGIQRIRVKMRGSRVGIQRIRLGVWGIRWECGECGEFGEWVGILEIRGGDAGNRNGNAENRGRNAFII